MASLAVYGGVSTSQGEAIVVLFHVFDRDLPSPYRVTLLAIRAQLPLVNIGVAVLAALADIGKDRFDVALRTSHRRVHPAQWIARLIVIELWNRPDGFPGVGGMTVLTRNIEIAVRAVRTRHLCLSAS